MPKNGKEWKRVRESTEFLTEYKQFNRLKPILQRSLRKMISEDPDQRPSLEEILEVIDENRQRERLWANFACKAIHKLDGRLGKSQALKKYSKSFKQ